MKSELGKMEGNEVLSGTQDTYLIEQDVPDLVEFLVSCSQHAFKQEKRRMHCLEAQPNLHLNPAYIYIRSNHIR